MSATCYRSDAALLHVLKECKTLPVFLDAIFGFLKRSTDFYVIAKESSSAIGLPPCMAENMVKDAFFKWQMMNGSYNLPSSLAINEVQLSDVLHEPPPIGAEVNKCNGLSVERRIAGECYNGAARDNYMWSQSISDLDITITLDDDVSSKDLFVKIEAKQITVKKEVQLEKVFAGDLPYMIKHNDAIWWVEKREHKLQIHLDKVQERWWDRLFVDDKPLDVTKLDCSRPFEELSEEAQAKIEELQYNQDRMREGLQTAKQVRLEETLKQAWSANGSPFCGQFDPSKVIIDHC